MLYIDRLQDGLSIFSGFININSINQTFQILLLLSGGVITASIINFSSFLNNSVSVVGNYIAEQKYLANYILIILFNLIGASCLITAGDLLTLYIAVETQSFSLYILSTLKNDSSKSASAGLKYFLIGSLASVFILLGIALFYYATGLTNFENIFIYYSITDWFSLDGFTAGIIEPNSPYDHTIRIWNFAEMNPYYSVGIFAIILIIIGILIKIGAAPFHQWTIDVYSLVPTAVTTWLVILPKIALFILLFQILELVLETGTAILYSSANNSIIDWMLNNSVINYIYNFTNNNSINVSYVTGWLNNFYYDHLISNIKNIYGDATHFYPHYLQIELLNTINSPIINESAYNFVLLPESANKDLLNNIWSDYSSNLHNSLYYTLNITPLGSITIKNLLILISIISLIIGAIGGLYQLNIKRLLAFSAISHVGFLLLALIINNKVSLESFIFYLGQYSLTNLNIFLILITFGYLSSIGFSSNFNSDFNYKWLIGSKNGSNLENNQTLITKIKNFDLNFISQLTGLFNKNPILTMSFTISLFSMAGIPPMLGFFAKQQVLLASLSVGFIFISIIAINTSVISAYYYLKLIQVSNFNRVNLIKLFNSKTISNNNPQLSIFNFKHNLFNKNTTDLTTSAKFGINKLDSDFFIRSYTPFYLNKINTKLSSIYVTNNIHSYLISILTLIILFYILKPNLLLNLTNILASYSFNL